MSIRSDIKESLLELVEIIKAELSQALENCILTLINAHEWTIALEIIYSYLDDNEVQISIHAYNLIQQTANMIGTKTRNWHSLESQIQEE